MISSRARVNDERGCGSPSPTSARASPAAVPGLSAASSPPRTTWTALFDGAHTSTRLPVVVVSVCCTPPPRVRFGRRMET